MKQLAHRHERIGLLNRPMAVDRLIAELRNHSRLVEHRLASGSLESRLVDQRAEVVLVGKPEGAVVLVRPRDRQFERPPGVEARRSRIGVDRRRPLCCRPRKFRATRFEGTRMGSS